MPYALNYEIRIDNLSWLDSGKPILTKDGGEYESLLGWLDQNYVDERGVTILKARASLYPAVPITQIGQKVHIDINVLKYSDFLIAAAELGYEEDELQEIIQGFPQL